MLSSSDITADMAKPTMPISSSFILVFFTKIKGQSLLTLASPSPKKEADWPYNPAKFKRLIEINAGLKVGKMDELGSRVEIGAI